GQVTAIIRNRRQILDLKAGDARENIYGIAFDIGTSKLVGSLFSLVTGNQINTAGVENPQLRFGEDIMLRLHYAAVSPQTRKEIQAAVINGLNSILQTLTSTGIPINQIYEVTVVGNTVMTSLFLGLDTTHLAYGPFVPPYRGPIETPSEVLGLKLLPQSVIYVLPNIAGFVGADAVANILATRLYRHKNPSLLIDIGTNSEVILGSREGISATSCAAGPAFEGAQIKHGMKAVSGAIERVTLNPESMTFQLTTIDDLEPVGICGSGVVDVIAQLVEANLLSKKGRFTKGAEPHLITEGMHRSILLHGKRSDKTRPYITLSEHDISQLLLAKAAIQTGYIILLKMHELIPDALDKIFIAGAFGNYLNTANARRIGLIPQVPLEKVVFVGNAALAGAQLTLLSTAQRKIATRLAITTKFIDLARHPDFSRIYAASLFI
ncbi:MAG: ASKHA domain-containing protein, partial [Candidatus Thorarchaeota archaeon]